MLIALGFQREVNHHDGVLLHNADQQDDSNKTNDVQIISCDQQRENGTHACRRQRRQNRDRMDIAFVQHAQNDVNGNYCGEDQPGLGRERVAECGGCPLETGMNAGGQVDLTFRAFNRLRRLS